MSAITFRSSFGCTATLFGGGLARFLALLAFALLLGGCGLLPEGKDETSNWNADKLYSEAHSALTEGNYTRAIKLFESLEARFPYGRYAQQAILESAYANYRASETAAAVAALDRFIRTYPNHPSVDYAYYLKGLVHFREDQGLLGYVYELDLSEREPKAMRESFAAFRELVAKFPDSRYAEDAVTRMKFLTNSLLLQPRRVRGSGQSRARCSRQLPAHTGQRGRARPAGEVLRQAGHGAVARRFAAHPEADVSEQHLCHRPTPEAVVEGLVARYTVAHRAWPDPDSRHPLRR
jgi:outer membrane assembly lipoprotein YfiO